jgi:hypothetical protein
MSLQFSDGSNCFETHAASDVTPVMPSTRPARLPKVLRLPRSTLIAQVGLVATSSRFESVTFGGTLIPFLMSQWRCPSMLKSIVTISVLTFDAFARAIMSRTKPRSRIT